MFSEKAKSFFTITSKALILVYLTVRLPIFVTYFAQDPNKIHIFFMTRVSYVSQDSRKIPSTVLKLAYRYIFFTVYQFFTQLIGILCPITFNICKYDKIHEIVCKNKQNLVKNM